MFEDEKKARMGVVECVKHDLVEPFTVLWEREGRHTQTTFCNTFEKLIPQIREAPHLNRQVALTVGLASKFV